MDTLRAAEWHRISLVVLSLGGDPTSFGSEETPIDLIADGIYNWSRTDSLGTQGINAWIFALLTLDANAYPVPEGAKYTRERILEELLAWQAADGGFGLQRGASDVDITAMALQALAPYDCAAAIDRALTYLSAQQSARGDFQDSAESTAQVIIALCSLGIDPRSDSRFVKAGGSAYDGLLLYFLGDGAFCHLLGEGADEFAGIQAGLACNALDRFDNGRPRLYDLRQEEDNNG